MRVGPTNLSSAAPRAPAPARRAPSSPHRPPLDFSSGHESSRPLDDALWRSALRAAVSPGGPQLTDAIAQHLRSCGPWPWIPRPSSSPRAPAPDSRSSWGRWPGAPGVRPRVAVESPGFPDCAPGPGGAGCGGDPGTPRRRRRGSRCAGPSAAPGPGPCHAQPSVPGGTALHATGRQALIGWSMRTGICWWRTTTTPSTATWGRPCPRCGAWRRTWWLTSAPSPRFSAATSERDIWWPRRRRRTSFWRRGPLAAAWPPSCSGRWRATCRPAASAGAWPGPPPGGRRGRVPGDPVASTTSASARSSIP